MNVLDVAENSVAAGSTLTSITVEIDTAKRLLAVTIADNGKGMDEETVRRVTDPFYTTRTTRKVGLGLPLFREAAEATGGALHIRSQPGRGTTVRATFTLGHIDLAPLGDMTGTVVGLVQCNPKIDFVYRVVADGGSSAWTPAKCGASWRASRSPPRRWPCSCAATYKRIPKIC